MTTGFVAPAVGVLRMEVTPATGEVPVKNAVGDT